MILDIIIVLVIAFGFYAGFSRGLINTVFDTLSLIIGVVAALKLSPIVINFLESMITVNPAITFLIGVVITFLLVMALIRFLGNKLEDVLEAANINVINKLAGGALQGIFFAFLLSMLLWLADNFKIINEDIKTESKTYAYIQPLPEQGKELFKKVEPAFKSFWDKTLETMDAIKTKAD